MDLLKQLLVYVVLIVAIWLAATFLLPLLSRASMAPDYSEIDVPDVEHYKTYSLEQNVPVRQLSQGQAVCYRLTKGESTNGNGFGYVAAIPGDTVEIVGGQLLVNGSPYKRSGPLASHPDEGRLVVPENHVYVVTTAHSTDSVARGPMPAAALRGRIAEFP